MSNRKKLPRGFSNEQWFDDQMDAAAAESLANLGRLDGPGKRRIELTRPGQAPYADRLAKMMAEQVDKPGNLGCGHFRPRRIEPQHWFAVRPEHWFCGRCAEPRIKRFEQVANWCDLCQRGYLHAELSVIHLAAGPTTIHAAICAACESA